MLVVLFCFLLLIGGFIVVGLCRREFIRFVLVNKFFTRGLFRIRWFVVKVWLCVKIVSKGVGLGFWFLLFRLRGRFVGFCWFDLMCRAGWFCCRVLLGFFIFQISGLIFGWLVNLISFRFVESEILLSIFCLSFILEDLRITLSWLLAVIHYFINFKKVLILLP